MATGGHSQPDFPVRMRQKPSPSPFREFSPGARPMSQQEDSLFSSANGRERSQTIGPSITSPSLFLRSKSLRSFKSKKHSDSAIHMERPNSGPLESIQHTDDSEAMLSEVIYKNWKFDEVVDILQSGMVTLPGGRDRNSGGAIIIVTLDEKAILNEICLGKALVYLSQVPADKVRELRFTVILDGRNAQLKDVQNALKAMQMTFSHHTGQVFVLKPKGLMQKFKSGSVLSSKKNKTSFPISVLDNHAELWQHIGINQVPSSLSGNLVYDHREWMDSAKIVDELHREVRGMLADFESLKHKMDSYVMAPEVYSAQLMLKEHIELSKLINADKMSQLARNMQKDIGKLRAPAMHPAAFTAMKHPDFVVRMAQIESQFGELNDLYNHTEKLWKEKMELLNQCLQLRIFEDESDKFVRWISSDGHGYLLSQTAVGMTTSQAQAALRDHESHCKEMMEREATYSRIHQMGQKLLEANSYGSKEIGVRMDKLRAQWEDFVRQLKRWTFLFQSSVEFHRRAQDFVDQLQQWHEKCRPFFNPPESVTVVEKLLREHIDIRQHYSRTFEEICYHGNKMMETMKEPVLLTSAAKHPAFVGSMRHVREAQQQCVQDENLLSQQWQKHSDYLQQLLTLKKFAVDSTRVKTWIENKGCSFLTDNVGIGTSAAVAEKLLQHHDEFEAASSEFFALCNKLVNEAKELSNSGRVDPDLMEDELASLEIAFGAFVGHLDERREIILMSKEFFQKVDHVQSLCSHICTNVPTAGVPYTLTECDMMNEEFERLKNDVLVSSSQVREAGQKLKDKMKAAITNAKRDEVFLEYNQGMTSVEKMLIEEEKKTEEVEGVISDRGNLLGAATHLRRFEAECRKFKGDFWYWLEVENCTEPAETLMNARLRQETFVRHQQSHISKHRDLVAEGEQLAVELDVYKSVIMVSPTDRTPGSAFVWMLVADLRKFLDSSQLAIEQLRDKLGKALDFETLKKEGRQVIGEVAAVMEDLLSVPGIGDSLEGVTKLQSRVDGIDGQLQATRISVDMFQSRALEVSTAQTNLAKEIAEIVKSMDTSYQEVAGCVSARRDMLRCAADHFQVHQQFQTACGECAVVFSTNVKDAPVTIPTCEEEQRKHQTRKDLLTSLASSAEGMSSVLLVKMDEWRQLIQGHQTKLEEGVDLVAPLPEEFLSSHTSLASHDSSSSSVNLHRQGTTGASWDGMKRHSASDLMVSKVDEEMSSTSADRHSWDSSSRRVAFAKKGRSTSVSHSYSASRRYTSPQPFAAKRCSPTTQTTTPNVQKGRMPSLAPNSDPISRKNVMSSFADDEGRLKRHASEEYVSPKTPHRPAGKNLSSPAYHPTSHQFPSSTIGSRPPPSSNTSEYQLSRAIYSKYISWDETDLQMVVRMVDEVKQRTGELLVKWHEKQTFLENTATWLQFKILADEILLWHDKDCVTFMTDCSYGDSIDDVEGLIGRHQEFVEGQMPLYFSKVQKLISWSQDLGKSGTVYLQSVQSHAVDVSTKWRKAVEVATNRKNCLQEALTFHVKLFEANNWCSKTHTFLDEMEKKLSICEESSDARELSGELEGYMMFTRGDQLKREGQMSSTAEDLDSRHLTELVRQVQTSTKEYSFQYETLKDELEKREKRLLQIEKEQDDKSRAAKQRDRVVEELLETERVYTFALTQALKMYMPIVLNGEDTPETVKTKAGTIFGNLETVETYHREEFLPKLELCGNDCNRIAALFLDEAQRMTTIHVGYCGGKTKSETVIIEHRPFFDQLKMRLEVNESLSSYLIRPIQRITKYPLMMKDAIRYTQQAGQDASQLIECYTVLETIPKRTNDAVHLSALEDYDEPFVELGELRHQGLLFVSESRTLRSTEKERQIFLFDRAILICRRDVLDNAQVHYSFRHKIDFLSTTVKLQEPDPSEQSDSYKFGLVLRSEQRLTFRATSQTNGKEWVENIRKVLRTHKVTGYGKPSPPSFRDGRRRGAVVQPKPGERASDSDDNFINSPRSRTMPRIRSLTARPTLPSTKYIVTEEYIPADGSGGLTVKKGDRVEVLDSEGDELWLGKTLLTPVQKQGWIPPHVLMPLMDSSNISLDTSKMRTSPILSRAKPPLRPGSAHGLAHMGVSTTSVPSYILSPPIIVRSKSISPPPPPPWEQQTLASRNVEAVATYSRSSKQSRPPLTKGLFQRSSLRGSKKKKHKEGDGDGSGSSTPVNSQSPRVSRVFDDVNLDNISVDTDPMSYLGNVPTALSNHHTQLSSTGSKSSLENQPLSQASSGEDTVILDHPGRTKITILIRRLQETESTYIKDLFDLIKGYMKQFQGREVPESLRDKKKLLFGNIKAIHSLHSGMFMQLLQESGESHEEVAKSFLELVSDFESYSIYCENAPRASALLWGPAKLFVEKCQEELTLQKGLSQYLSAPLQRLAMYDYYLEEMLKTAEYYSLETSHLKVAHTFIRQMREKGGDTSQLALIVGYDGNIYSNGAIVKQEDIFVSEDLSGDGEQWISHVFLLEQRIIFTRSLDGTRLYEYFDSLPLSESLLVDSPRDNPLQLTIADFRPGDIEQCYRLQTLTAALRDEWAGAIRDSLAKQLQILHSVRQNGAEGDMLGLSPSFLRERRRKVSENPAPLPPDSDSSSISEDWDGKEKTVFVVATRRSLRGRPGSGHERPPLSNLTIANNSYIVKQDWSFEDDFEVIPEERMSPKPVRKGQVFDIIEQDSFWWKARLVKDSTPPGSIPLGKEVWVPSSHMEKKKAPPPPPRRVDSLVNNTSSVPPPKQIGNTLTADVRERSTSFTTASIVSLDSVSNTSSTRNEEYSQSASSRYSSSTSLNTNSDSLKSTSQTNVQGEGKIPVFAMPVSTLNVPVGSRIVKLTCTLEKDLPGLTVRWFHNGQPVTEGSNRAPMKFGPTCNLDLVCVRRQDAGNYVCMASIGNHTATATVEVVVTTPPGPPLNVTVEYVTENGVALSWTPPTDDGGAPITSFSVLILTENDQMLSTYNFSAAELSCVLEELDPSMQYLFRVRASNELGQGEPSAPSLLVTLASNPIPQLQNVPFGDFYEVVKGIARGRYSVVQECKQKKNGHTYAVKKYLKASLLQEWAGNHPDSRAEEAVAKRVEQELVILLSLSHPCFPVAYEGFSSDTAFNIVTEYIEGRPLLDYMIDKDTLQESLVVDVCSKLLNGLQYLHSQGVAHFDVLPENILAVDSGVVPELKLVGFGNASHVGGGHPEYLVDINRVNVEFSAPEVIESQPVSTATDIWSVGVLTYVILTGLSPFAGSNKAMTMSNITSVKFSLPQQYFSDVSPEAKDFIKQLLVRDEGQRLTASQCLEHPWLKVPDTSASLKSVLSRRRSSCNKLDTSRLKVFNASRAWKASLHSKKRRSLVGVQQKS